MKKQRKDAWQQSEKEIVKLLWKTSTKEQLLEKLPNRTWGSIERQITILGLGKQRKNGWTTEEDERLKTNWLDKTDEELTKLFPNRTWNAIELRAPFIGLAGLKRDRFRWNKDELDTLKRLWGTVKIEEVCAAIPNRAAASIQVKATSLGLVGDASLAHRVYGRNEQFFDIPNPLNSYYAGWLASDGCISPISENKVRVQISLQEGDIDMLEGLKLASNYKGPIGGSPSRITKICSDKESVCKPQKRLQICCKPWAIALANNWNIVPAKSLIYLGPKSHGLENDLCFILGMIEGDGFISVRDLNNKRIPYLGVCGGSKVALQFIENLFDREFPHWRESTINGEGVHSYHIVGDRAITILRRFYKLPVPHLKRKWDNPELLSLLYPEKQNPAQTPKSGILLV